MVVRAAARTRHGAQGPAAGKRQDLLGAGQGAGRRRQPQRTRTGGRQPRQYQRAHRAAQCAVAAGQELHGHDAPRPQSQPGTVDRKDRSRARGCEESHHLGQSFGDPVSGFAPRNRWRQAGAVGGRGELVQRALHSDRAAARRRRHQGARHLVGRLRGLGCSRSHSRLGARPRPEIGSAWASPPTAATAFPRA